MDDVPLRLVPLWRETPDDGRFTGCLVAQDRMSPATITNDQSDALWEFSAVLSLDAVKGPYAPQVWNVAVNVKRYEPNRRIRQNGELFYEDLVCGSGFGICPVPMESRGVAADFRWLLDLTENERVVASGSVILGKSLRLEGGREVSIRWYPDRARTVVSYAIAVWPGVPGKLSVYTASQEFDARCAPSGRDAFRTVVILDELSAGEQGVRTYPVGSGVLKVARDDGVLNFSLCRGGQIAQFRVLENALAWPLKEPVD